MFSLALSLLFDIKVENIFILTFKVDAKSYTNFVNIYQSFFKSIQSALYIVHTLTLFSCSEVLLSSGSFKYSISVAGKRSKL